MPPENPPSRRWRFRPRLWMIMVALPVIALALVYGAGNDPFRRNPYWTALDEAQRWCASGFESFHPRSHFDDSKSEPGLIYDESGRVKLPCLVKIRYVTKIPEEGSCDVTSYSLSQDGRMEQEHDLYNWAVQGGWHTLTPAQTAECKKLVGELPRSQGWIPIGNAISIGFLDRGTWSTRVYDKARLPPGVAALGKAMEINFH
jgi:hypothetical protein